jgi:CRP-like cAMP-binding protein
MVLILAEQNTTYNLQLKTSGSQTLAASIPEEQVSFIEAVEPSVILQIDRTNLVYLYHHHPKFDRIFRIIIEQKFIELQNRVLQTISSTAAERYERFLTQYPSLATRLPNTQIASYIGITPEFLSKIRRINVKNKVRA